MPAYLMSSWSRAFSVDSKPVMPKSIEWLLAKDIMLKPYFLASSSTLGSARRYEPPLYWLPQPEPSLMVDSRLKKLASK